VAKSSTQNVYEGARPTHSGDLTLETQGMAPIPENNRYGSAARLFTVWFAPNMGISAVFIGTLATVFGLGFKAGFWAILLGVILGAVPVALLCTWGPQTGTGQLPLSRMPFGKSVVLPGAIQWVSAIGWISLGALFGGQAAQLLFHVPFWVGLLIVLVCEATISILGYEYVEQAQTIGSVVMTVLFAVLIYQISQHHIVLPQNTVSGSAMVGSFVLMMSIVFGAAFSWTAYASDYSRYLPKNISKVAVFGWTFAGLFASYMIVLVLGLTASSLLSNQTAAGVQTLMGGGVAGVLALVAIVFASIVAAAMNDYSASLAFQALGVRIKRPFISGAVMILAFMTVFWLNNGDTATKFQSILLFATYWLAPFVAIVLIDWNYNGKKYLPSALQSALMFRNLRSGWPALVSFVIGFLAMIPFMDTTLVVGFISHKLQGADLAFYVGFLVTAVLYLVLRKFQPAYSAKKVTPAPAAATS
jgi:NCS1 family nucleobase:cation symporter-1